ncbi:MAG: cation diffusion facilitator family transporter [Leptospiraceae bacterium]|nr:cation diffusion facilitator family transporter [Leptospiraceae bacterium]MDW7974958.1 cation diffusion facilitator family transporter [Leptospiraceae bacterium]
MHHFIKKNTNKIFIIGISLNATYVAIEFSFGLYFHSLSLISDAVHNLSDVLSLGIAWLGYFLSTQKPNFRRTYGLKKASIMAALINSVILFIAVGGIMTESLQKLYRPIDNLDIQGMLKVAIVGVIVNFGTAFLFYRREKEDLNFRSAFIHMLTDGLITISVIISAIIIGYTQFFWIDPLMSFLIALVILWGTWKIFYESLNLMIDAVPQKVDLHEIHQYLKTLPGVQNVHDLHVWAISTTEVALTAHIVRTYHDDNEELLERIRNDLEKHFDIDHATIQFEKESNAISCRHCD